MREQKGRQRPEQVSGVFLGEDRTPVRGAQASEKARVCDGADGGEHPRHGGKCDGTTKRSQNGAVQRAQRRQERDQEGTQACPRHHRNQAKTGVGGPAGAALAQGLDVRRRQAPSDAFGGRDDEHELVEVEDGSMALELFTGGQPNPQGTLRRARICEVIGERNMGWPCWVSHGLSKKSTTPVSRQYSAPTISNPSSATRRYSTAEPCRRWSSAARMLARTACATKASASCARGVASKGSTEGRIRSTIER